MLNTLNGEIRQATAGKLNPQLVQQRYLLLRGRAVKAIPGSVPMERGIHIVRDNKVVVTYSPTPLRPPRAPFYHSTAYIRGLSWKMPIKNIWIGTHGGGLPCITPQMIPGLSMTKATASCLAIRYNRCCATAVAHDGVGTDGEGLSLFDKQKSNSLASRKKMDCKTRRSLIRSSKTCVDS